MRERQQMLDRQFIQRMAPARRRGQQGGSRGVWGGSGAGLRPQPPLSEEQAKSCGLPAGVTSLPFLNQGGFPNQGVQGPFGRFRGEGLATWIQKTPGEVKELCEDISMEAMMVRNWIKKRLVLIGDNQPLDKALQRLNRHKIESVPVISDADGHLVGLLDNLAICYYLTRVLEMERLAVARWDFNLQPVKNVLGYEMGEFGTQNRAMLISNEANMWDAVQLFARGVRRLAVMDCQCECRPLVPLQPQAGMILGLFCQSDVIDFFSSNPYWLRLWPKSNHTLKELGLLNHPAEHIQTFSQDQPTYQGFKKMVECNSNALAIVDDQGRLVAALSSSNIRGLSRRNFQLVLRPVYEFLQRDRRRGWWTMPVLADPDDTLDKLIFKLGSTRVHQAFVVDSQGKPSHIITLTDIIRLLVPSQSS